jgi:putative transposase
MKASGNKNWLVQWRQEFICAVQQGDVDFATLCRCFRFSRQTGYKFWRRYQAEGEPGLQSRSRAPHHHGRSRLAHWRQRVRQLRLQHRAWGAKKIHAALPARARPAISTVGRWLRQLGLSARRRPRPRRGPVQPLPPLTVARRSNQVWTVDFKGSFCTAEGTRLHPLTVRDLFSRYVLCVRAWPYQREEPVRHLFAKLFRHYGQPSIIRCDHGVPWSSTGPLGLSRLSVWWWRLGIRVEFTAKGHPEQNAAHEQHHRVLKADTLRPPAPTPTAQQQRFQRWRYYYNYQRPHEALKQKTPASRYRPRRKGLTPVPVLPRYDRAVAVRRVHPNGEIVWEGRRRFIGDALAGQHVGLVELAKGIWSVRFLDLELGHLHRADPGAMRPAFHSRFQKLSTMQ